LSRSSLDTLLYALHPDRDRAGLEYEALRERLVHFFELRWTSNAEELADEALNRLAKRLSEGQIVNQIPHYLLGIARLLLLERAKEQHLQPLVDREVVVSHPATEDPVQEAFQSCLEELSFRDRQLLERYYGEEGVIRIQNREILAHELGISVNALLNRVMRLRAGIERCTQERLGRRSS
jgi:DNA-directed RNA polymerase specialized sigma24 family protein